MSGDPMKLVKFVCVARAHASRQRDAILTIHDGVWAFCPLGLANGDGHDWQVTDGLPLSDLIRFSSSQQAPDGANAEPAPETKPSTSIASKSRARAH